MALAIDTTCCFVQTRIELDHYPDFQNDTAFVTELIAEQGVTCMPGSVILIFIHYAIMISGCY